MQHLLSLFDLEAHEIASLLDEAARLKTAQARREPQLTLAGKVLGLVFEKPSLRTRVSFQAAMAQLGGASLYMSGTEVGLGTREPLPDFARVMSQYVDGIVLRTFLHQTVEDFASHAHCPVINGLSDTYHPCQALADLLTIRETFDDPRSRTVAFVGDGNNVARSLAIGCAKLGLNFILAAPKGYGFDDPFLKLYRKLLPVGGLAETHSPRDAVAQADIIYTDVWASMGQEQERDARLRAFAPFQVNQDLLQHAPPHARVMHCLPAHRGEEISAEVMDGERCIAFDQAANRLHAQKALLLALLAPL